LTEFKLSLRGNKYVLVVMDHYTRFVEMFALPDKSAKTVGRCLLTEIFTRYGWPEAILNDNGAEFDNALIAELCGLGATKQMFTSPYHPETNGMCERFMRTMKSKLRSSVSDFQVDWDDHLPAIRMAYNTAVHASTATTPGYLMFGRVLRTSADERFRAAVLPDVSREQESEADPIGLASETTRWAKVLEKHRRWSNERSQLKQERRAAAIDGASRSKFHLYEVGDWVMKAHHAHHSDSSRKLNPLFAGPYQITRKVNEKSSKVFELDDGDRRNADQLRPFVAGDENLSQGEYEVDYLYKEKRDDGPGVSMFRVRWRGYQKGDDSWVPESKITSTTLISEFRDRNKGIEPGDLRKESLANARLRHGIALVRVRREAEVKA
jgi:hypothetical protein